MEATDPTLPEALKKDDAALFNDYVAHANNLELELYELLSEMSMHVGMGPGTKGMAIIALTAATDLFKQCGIEGEEFLRIARASVISVENLYNALGINETK